MLTPRALTGSLLLSATLLAGPQMAFASAASPEASAGSSARPIASSAPTPTATTMNTSIATGTFDVQLSSAPPAPGFESARLGRMTLKKQFQGDLEGTSLGEMLGVRTPVEGSAGYVAMERVEARLAGRTGSFVMMHMGEMNRGQQRLTVQVVPDSATDELAGLSGTLTIDIKDGKHFYEFRYQLPVH